jgi:hypothetical protein
MALTQRVAYVEGQRITAADLISEQLYLLALDGRHNLGEHAPGVALGLVSSTDLPGDAIVAAGVAIDQQGRELLSSADVLSPAAPTANCVDLWIVYCLVPLPQRRPGTYDCSSSSFTRWREFGQIVASPGDRAGAPVPPYDGAVYLGRVNCNAIPDVSYVALKGQRLADPGARAWMQVGPANGRDRYGFFVTATDTAGSSHPKLAIDRQGKNTLWGDVNLLGYQADALLTSPVPGFLLKVVARIPGDAGEEILARLTPLRGVAEPALGLIFLYGGKPIEDMLHLARAVHDIRNQLEKFNKTSKLVSLSLVQEDPDGDKDRDVPVPSESLLTAQDTPLTATGNSLELRKWQDPPVPPTITTRGCVAPAPQDTPSQLPNGISFTPPARPVQGPALPGASAAFIGGDGVQVPQFRLDLGQKKENDPSRRLAIGEPDQNGNFNPWLTGDGTGNLHLLGAGTTQTPSMSLNVTGRIEQGPIQPDPTDPRFTALLVLAWLHGLQSSVQASTVVALAISGLPAQIETNKPWHYQVTATNSGAVSVTADKFFETRSIAGQTLLTNIANQTVINPGANQVFNISHTAGDVGVTGDLSIEVRMSGKIGNFPWWKAATAGPIPVVQSPALDLSDLPSSAPPDADFNYTFTVVNPANIGIHVTSVTVTEGNGAAQQLSILNADIPSNGRQTFGPVDHHGGIGGADLTVQIVIDFTWANGHASSVTANRTIKSLVDLQIKFQNITNPMPIGGAWSYDLVLTNIGNQALTIPKVDSLKQRLSIPDFQPTSWTNIQLGADDIKLKPNESQTVAGIAATTVPQATHRISLEVDLTYERELRSWNPKPTTTDIVIS